MDVILKLNEKSELDALSITTLKSKIVQTQNNQSFLIYGDSLVKHLLEAGQIGNARSYKGVLSVIQKFNKGRDLSFNEVTYKFLSEFEKSHKQKGNQVNGLAVLYAYR